MPVLDGLERLGVVQFEFADPAARVEDALLHDFAALVAELVLSKNAYGDLFTVVRRRRPMSLAGEIAWNLMPPLTFGTERVVISCVLAPAYDVGGDSFDHAVDDSTARPAVFDAMGHGLDAGLLASVATAAYRRARRTGLDLAAGRLRWHSAAHPAPLLLRGTRVVKSLDAEPGLPLSRCAG